MSHQLMSRRKAQSLALALFLLGLAMITYTKYWWPGIMLAVGIPMAVKQFLWDKKFEMIVSLLVFLGAFITVQFNIKWEMVLPVLFTLGGIYVFVKEFFGPKDIQEEDIDEDLNHEIEEDDEEHDDHEDQ